MLTGINMVGLPTPVFIAFIVWSLTPTRVQGQQAFTPAVTKSSTSAPQPPTDFATRQSFAIPDQGLTSTSKWPIPPPMMTSPRDATTHAQTTRKDTTTTTTTTTPKTTTTTATATESPKLKNIACNVNCTFLSVYLANSFFKDENGTELSHYVWLCTVNGTHRDDQQPRCSVDIKTIIGNIPQAKLAEFTLLIKCTFPVRLRILNEGGMKRENLVSYLDIRQCVVDWRDAIVFGKAVDFRVMNILWPVKFSPEDVISTKDIIAGNDSNDAIVYQKEGPPYPNFVQGRYQGQGPGKVKRSARMQMIQGLHNLGSLVILNPAPCSRPEASLRCAIKPFERKELDRKVPNIFTKYLWPRMAEVMFSDLDLDDEAIYKLRKTMPYLQALDIVKNRRQFRELPAFPWFPWRMRLPKKIARTTTGNSHYAGRMVIAPNVYRRVFLLDRSPIPAKGLKLQGVLDKITVKSSILSNDMSTGDPSADLFNNTRGVQRVDISHNNIKNIPLFYANAGSIKELIMDYNNITQIKSYTLGYMNVLETLSIAHNKIDNISNEAFLTTSELEEINLSYNRLVLITKGTFYDLSELKTLALDHNELVTVELDATPAQNKNKLITLDMSYNKLAVLHSQMILFRFATRIDLSNNKIESEQLSHLLTDTDGNSIIYILNESNSGNNLDIEPYGGEKKYIDFSENNIEHIYLEKKNASQLMNFQLMLTFFRIDLTNNPLNCDCRAHALHQFLVGHRANATDHSKEWLDDAKQKWICAQPRSLETIPIEDVPENKFSCRYAATNCPPECTCSKRMTDDVTVVDCADRNLNAIPERMPGGLLELHFENNQIGELPVRGYLKSVVGLWMSRNDITEISREVVELLSKTAKYIYLEYNKISRVSKSVMTLWKGVIKLDLTYNLLVCDCHSEWLRDWIIEAPYLVNGLKLRCASDETSGGARGRAVLTVESHEFVCKTEIPKIIAIIFGTFFILLIVAFVLVVRYRQGIKIWLYAKYDWHPFDKVDDSDPSLTFDAFICYSSLDYDWVVHTLWNKLENELNPPYKLLLHQRDFIPGQMTMDSIYEGVNSSKRMIMLVTQNFVRSDWCMAEFRTAHHEVLSKNTRNYLIAILGEDLDIESVPEDFKVFLKNTTYLKRDETNFWDRLFYALPQKGPRRPNQTNPRESNGCAAAIPGRPCSVISNCSVTRRDISRQFSTQTNISVQSIGNGQPLSIAGINDKNLNHIPSIRNFLQAAKNVRAVPVLGNISAGDNGLDNTLEMVTCPPENNKLNHHGDQSGPRPVSASGVFIEIPLQC